MSELWQGVVWSVAFSIPIGIAINLVSPLINRRIDSETKEAASKRAERDAAFRAKASRLAKDRSLLYVELLEVLLRVAFFTALFGVLSGAAFLIGQAIQTAFIYEFASVFFTAGQLVALVGTIIVLNITRPAIVLIREVRTIHEAE